VLEAQLQPKMRETLWNLYGSMRNLDVTRTRGRSVRVDGWKLGGQVYAWHGALFFKIFPSSCTKPSIPNLQTATKTL